MIMMHHRMSWSVSVFIDRRSHVRVPAGRSSTVTDRATD
jgi:hypothetical protein